MHMRNLNSNWIVGFVDGDGHFGFSKNTNIFYFVVSQDKRSIHVLYLLKQFFKCGSVHKAGKNMRQYKVSAKDDLRQTIIPFFQKNGLQTSKKIAFEKFVKGFDISLYKELKNPEMTIDWLAGFVDAEGCFVCSIINRRIRPQFILGLNLIDKKILDKIKIHLTFGVRYQRKNGVEIFQLSSNKTMCDFAQLLLLKESFTSRLRTTKRLRAQKWAQIVFLMKNKQHKTNSGFILIQKLHSKF